MNTQNYINRLSRLLELITGKKHPLEERICCLSYRDLLSQDCDRLGKPWKSEAEEPKALRAALPCATTQLQVLEIWNGEDISALELIQTLQPFNFR